MVHNPKELFSRKLTRSNLHSDFFFFLSFPSMGELPYDPLRLNKENMSMKGDMRHSKTGPACRAAEKQSFTCRDSHLRS